ncbi:MAG: D-aminoacyl-tRNA deacylase [Bacteroidota bacterium]
MRALLQRVKECSVEIGGKAYSTIPEGLLIFLGVGKDDVETEADSLAERCSSLRIFNDDAGKMNLSIIENLGSVMIVSQFTLYADTRKGNRPGYSDAAPSQIAEKCYDRFCEKMRFLMGTERVTTGKFGAMMDVKLVNDGPVTVMLESKERKNV